MSTRLYSGPEVVITHEVFAVRGPVPQRFRIRDLRRVHVVRGELALERVVTAHLSAGAFVAALVMAPILDSPFALVVMVVTAITAMGANVLCAHLRPRVYEIRALYRGFDVCLYRSADAQRFGQVRRALARALKLAEAMDFHNMDFHNWGTTGPRRVS